MDPTRQLVEADPIAPGAMLDRYRIVRHVASGGMGSVWEARFDGKYGFSKRVAIKAILPELAAERRFKEMFLEEARLTSRLSHAHVAQVIDVGDFGGAMYIVFEWVDGESLETICRTAEARGESLPMELALRVAADVCAGLHAAHELVDDDGAALHVVHRDVTPHNVLVSRDGYAKVIDFGLAKARDRIGAPTRSGLVKGTPQFMSPEQAAGRPIDRRADVFSAGALLYRVLAGHPPFPDRESLAAFIHAERGIDMPAGIPDVVRAIIAKAMRRDPAERFATAAEMRRALEHAAHHPLDDAAAARPIAPELAPTPIENDRVPLFADSAPDLDATAPRSEASVRVRLMPRADASPRRESSRPSDPSPPMAITRPAPSRGLVVGLVLAVFAVAFAVTFAFMT